MKNFALIFSVVMMTFTVSACVGAAASTQIAYALSEPAIQLLNAAGLLSIANLLRKIKR